MIHALAPRVQMHRSVIPFPRLATRPLPAQPAPKRLRVDFRKCLRHPLALAAVEAHPTMEAALAELPAACAGLARMLSDPASGLDDDQRAQIRAAHRELAEWSLYGRTAEVEHG